MRRLMKQIMPPLVPLAAAVFLISSFAGEPVSAEITEKGLFGMVEISSDNLEALPRWQKVMESFPDLAAAATACDAKIEDCKSQQMTLWRTKIAELEREDKRIQMHGINRFLNGWKHNVSDPGNGSDAEWIAPSSFFRMAAGRVISQS